MRVIRRLGARTGVAILAAMLFAPPTFPQEGGRPERGNDPRRGVESDVRGRDDAKVDDRQRAEDRWRAAETDVTRRRTDPAKDQASQIHDAAALDADIKASEAKENRINSSEGADGVEAKTGRTTLAERTDPKARQAEHSWDGHENEFRKLGINSPEQLRNFAEQIRENPDVKKDLERNRTAYGKFSENGGKSGTIVIDAPNDKQNGGTIMTNEDISGRIKRLK